MQFLKTDLPGVLLIEPDVHLDGRGFFLESFHTGKYAAAGIAGPFVQDNHSCSVRGTVRGLHGQIHHPQGKLVRTIHGEVYDVAVDLRRDSPTFLQWRGFHLSSENFRQLYVPPGFLHGFCVLSDLAEFEYKCTDFYRPTEEIAVRWNDPAIGIAWPVESPLLSRRDGAALSLEAALPLLSASEDWRYRRED